MIPAAALQAASFQMDVLSGVSNLYLQKVNRDLQKAALNRQLTKAKEVSLRNTEASADMLAELREIKMREQLGIQKQKATAKGQARVQAAQIGGSATPALEAIELKAGEAGLSLEVKVEQAITDVMSQAKSAVQSIKDQLFSMDMSITPYDILTPLTQIGKAALGAAGSAQSMGKNVYGQDINPSDNPFLPR